jgi:membrane protein DedA with SNARE-associated domain
VTDLLTMATSPAWAYLALLALLVVDAFVPVVPTQAIMISAGALAGYGLLDIWATLIVGAVGVFAGDLGTYLLGRGAGHPGGDGRLGRLRRRWVDRLKAHSDHDDEPGRARRAAARFTRGLRTPGPLVLLLCRFVPGGRMAAGFNAGRQEYPARLFVTYDGLAAAGWATYGGLVGHIGGTALTQSAWKLFGVAAAAALVFGAAGWVLALTGGHDDDEEPTGARAASADEPPRRSNRTATGRS